MPTEKSDKESGGIRILLVEDSQDQRLMVKTVLESSGFFDVVGEASNGDEGIKLAQLHQPEIVLLDLSMPKMSGLDALPHFRVAAPGAKVVVLSSLSKDEMGPLVFEKGALGFLEKGLHPARLVDELLALGGILEIAEQSLTTSLSPDPRSAGTARRFVSHALERWNCGHLLDTVVLLVSELVNNAVIHGGSDVRIAVKLEPEIIHVDVYDGSSELPVMRTASNDDLSGRGLLLVEELANDWGYERLNGGKRVWFEVPRPGLEQVDTE